MSFLDELKAEVDKVEISDSFNPEQKIEKGELVIGEMTDEQKKIFIFLNLNSRNRREILMKYHKTRSRDEKAKYLSLIQKFLSWEITLYHLLYLSINEKFGLFEFDDDQIGIRKNWKVVTSKSEKKKNEFEYLVDLIREYL